MHAALSLHWSVVSSGDSFVGSLLPNFFLEDGLDSFVGSLIPKSLEDGLVPSGPLLF